MTFPVFASGDVLTATDMNAVGLWRVATGTASAASTLSVNSCFTSDYENYMIVWNGRASVDDRSLQLRFRASGTDAATGYRRTINQIYPGLNPAAAGGSNAATELGVGSVSTGKDSACIIFVFAPQTAKESLLNGLCTHVQSSGNIDTYSFWGMLNNTTSYDGFTLFPNTGNITGTVRVYGLRNA